MKLNAYYMKQYNEAMAELERAKAKVQLIWDNHDVDMSETVSNISKAMDGLSLDIHDNGDSTEDDIEAMFAEEHR